MADGHGSNRYGQGKIRTVYAKRIAGEKPPDCDDDRQQDASQRSAGRAKARCIEAEQDQNCQRGTQRLPEKCDQENLAGEQCEYKRNEADDDRGNADEA